MMINQKINQRNEEFYYKTDSYLIILDSRNADMYSNGTLNSDVTFEMKFPIIVPNDCLAMTMNVHSFVCPISWYLINSTNNLLSITANSILYNISIPYGNYNINSFQTALLALLPVGFLLTFNNLNNKLTMSYTSTFSINANSTIHQIMGFLKKTVYTSSSNNIILPFTVNFSGLNSINILCENVRTSNLDSKDNLTPSSIIANISVNNASNNMIYFEKQNDFSFDVKEKTIDYLDISIQDSLGNKIDFNNQNWDLVIQVNYYREIPKDSENTFNHIIGNLN